MLIFPGMIAQAAKEAGMKVPDDPEGDFDKNLYPHFHVFCNLQLCRPMQDLGEHWENAKVIAKIPEERLRRMSLEDFINEGLSYAS